MLSTTLQASSADLGVLFIKLVGSGVSLGMLLVAIMTALSQRRVGLRGGVTYTFFIVANVMAAMYVSADTAVRIGVLYSDSAVALALVRIATGGVVLSGAAYIALYWVLEKPVRPPWRRVAALYTVAVAAALIIWVEHPLLVIASDKMTYHGLAAFPEYGAGAPYYFALLLLIVAAVIAGLLRSPLRKTDRLGWSLNLAGLAIMLTTGAHDVVREYGYELLPFGTLWFGAVCFQIGAFIFLTLHYARLMREHRQQTHKLQMLSDAVARDRATGLYSRAYMQELLDRVPARGGLLFIDLDDFKHVNDHYGHLCGDAVLNAIAQILLTELRGSDIPCRWGGDEFVIYLPQGDAEQARIVAARLLKSVHAVKVEGAPNLRVGISLGYAPLGAEGWRQSAEMADRALYRSKRAGKDRLSIADKEDREEGLRGEA